MAELKAEITAELIDSIREKPGFQNMKDRVAEYREMPPGFNDQPVHILDEIARLRTPALADSIAAVYKPKERIQILIDDVEFVHEEQRLFLICRYPETLIIQACKREKTIEDARNAMLRVYQSSSMTSDSGMTLDERIALVGEYGYKIVLVQRTPEEWALPILVESVKKKIISAPHPFDNNKHLPVISISNGFTSGFSLINIIDIIGPNQEVRVTYHQLTLYSGIIEELEKGRSLLHPRGVNM